ncbi:hypothetical protein Tco_1246913 [Tanacetum coccineum]
MANYSLHRVMSHIIFDNRPFPRPPSGKPPDVEICFNFEPDSAVINNFDVLNNDEPFNPGEVKIRSLTPASPLRAGGFSSGWNFHVRISRKGQKIKTKPDETEHRIGKSAIRRVQGFWDNKDNLEKPKIVRPSAPIIEDWDTDSDNDSVFRPKTDQTKPKFTKINFVKSDENVKSINKENTHRQVEYPRKSQSPRDNRRNWNGLMTQKLGNDFEYVNKACFVCGSFNHLIKDCDFHDKKMVEKPVLNNKGRVIGQIITKSGQVPVNTAKQNSPRVAASISIARPVNTVVPKSKVNVASPITYSCFKSHSLVKKTFNQKSAAKSNKFNEKVNTTRIKNVTTAGPKAVVSAAMGNGENAGNLQYTLQDQGIFGSGCSRDMTGNKSFLIDYQEIDGGFVAFEGSPK